METIKKEKTFDEVKMMREMREKVISKTQNIINISGNTMFVGLTKVMKPTSTPIINEYLIFEILFNHNGSKYKNAANKKNE